jgi:hypothetical protein
MKNDIREYSDEELSLTVMNDEPLYREVTRRTATHRSIIEFVSELFIYTPEQLAELLDTVDADREERYQDSLGN